MNKSFLVLLSTGFALFSMFFGSGNLVFPITVGLESEGHYFTASLGVLCTCVLFPFLGMYGMTLYKGSISEFFSCFGKKGVFLFSLLALSLMGPFGVLARCLTVIHGALQLLYPELPLGVTSFSMCLLTYFLAVNKNRLMTLLGNILTPVLLMAIAAIVFFGLNQATLPESTLIERFAVFKNGFFRGYQTMDLVASFFFSGFVIKYLYQARQSAPENETQKLFLKSSVIGAGLLYAVYFALVLLGWLYSPVLAGIPPQEMFGKIAFESLGSMAAPAVCLVVVFACLTTAITLASLFSEFLRVKVAKEKINRHLSLFVTLAIAFFVSNLEFSGIANFLGPILETIYPALITLTVINIFSKLYGVKSTHWPFTVTVVTKMCWL